MAKRKITVTVDEDLVAAVQVGGADSMSAVVNTALAHEVDRRARGAALARLLDEWESEYGPVPAEAASAAREAFDDVDAVAVVREAHADRQPTGGTA